MVQDARSSRSPESGTVTFTAGDAGTAKDLISIADQDDLSLNDYLFSYDDSGSNNATVLLYDDDEGTSAGSLSGKVDSVELSPGDTVDVDDIVRKNITNDLIVVVENNNADVSITTGAYKL